MTTRRGTEDARAAETRGGHDERRRKSRRGPAVDGHPGRRSSLFSARTDDERGRRRGRPLPPLPERARPGVVAAAVGVVLKTTVMVVLSWALCFNFSEVRGASMMPGIHDRDRILVDHVTYLFAAPGRGDIVVLRYPMDPSVDYVKRIVGLPGDHVQIYDGFVWVNGERVDEPYVDPKQNDPFSVTDTVVKEGSYFVLGDNRIRSSDSREFGLVPHEYLRGKVRARLWPIARVGLFD
ncbi:MAG: signal peptidase I [Planctomycetota bacterium]